MTTLPPDHAARLARARLSLDGLSVGDAFCAQFFVGHVYQRHFAARSSPPGPWGWTDDTAKLLQGCPCERGCPSCVQSPKCGNLNEPLDKAGALDLLERMLGA